MYIFIFNTDFDKNVNFGKNKINNNTTTKHRYNFVKLQFLILYIMKYNNVSKGIVQNTILIVDRFSRAVMITYILASGIIHYENTFYLLFVFLYDLQ